MSHAPAAPAVRPKRLSRLARYPVTVVALLLPGGLFVLGLYLVREQPRFAWLRSFRDYPWELWVLAACGCAATLAGLADWQYHRSGRTTVGPAEHRSEALALAGGGLPLFGVMATASVLPRPGVLLVPAVVLALFTTVLVCYDEFVFHRKRCGRYETALHRVLVFGNGLAWLAWAHWLFVRIGNG